MRSVSSLFRSLHAHRVRLIIDGDAIHICAPKGSVTRDLRQELISRKTEIVHHALQARRTSETRWQCAVERIEHAWNSFHTYYPDAPSVDDRDLEEAVGDAIRTSNLEAARVAIDSWGSLWSSAIEEFKRLKAPGRRRIERDAARASAREIIDVLDDPSTPPLQRDLHHTELIRRAANLFSQPRAPP
jgi:hypothetical protein